MNNKYHNKINDQLSKCLHSKIILGTQFAQNLGTWFQISISFTMCTFQTSFVETQV